MLHNELLSCAAELDLPEFIHDMGLNFRIFSDIELLQAFARRLLWISLPLVEFEHLRPFDLLGNSIFHMCHSICEPATWISVTSDLPALLELLFTEPGEVPLCELHDLPPMRGCHELPHSYEVLEDRAARPAPSS